MPGIAPGREGTSEDGATLLDNRFDGDEVHYSLLLDNMLAYEARGLAPKYSLFDMDKPLGLSGAAGLPKPVVSAISSFLEH